MLSFNIVLRFEMSILLSFLFVLFYGLLFNNFSDNEVCIMMMSPASMMAVTINRYIVSISTNHIRAFSMCLNKINYSGRK